MNLDLFTDHTTAIHEEICTGAWLLRGFAANIDAELFAAISHIVTESPLRKMYTPSGLAMSVTTTSCGDIGWVSDAYGYRYAKRDIKTRTLWPKMPSSFLSLAQSAAAAAGYNHFYPDSCLINQYSVGAKMSLHQDKNELDFSQPIVSVSLGLPATFLFGGPRREDKVKRIELTHGDVVVWGGSARLYFHGILPIESGHHPLTGRQRFNLTFRRAI